MNGKVAPVLGVGPNLGAAIARRFASEGFAVVLVDRNEDGLSEIQREIWDGGGTALLISTDAMDPASVEAAFGRVRDEIGDPDRRPGGLRLQRRGIPDGRHTGNSTRPVRRLLQS